MKFIMQILDIDYFLKDGRPVIRIFGKKPNGQTVCAMHEGIRPYFYCEYNEKAAEKIEELGLEFEIVDRKSAIGYAVEPQKFCKVYTVTPSEVPDVRMSLSPFTKCYEADILFTYRYMVDSGIGGMKWVAIEGDVVKTTLTKSGIETYLIRSTEPIENIENAPLRYMCLDIECLQLDSRRAPEAGHDPIIMIALEFSPDFKGKKSMVLVAKRAKNMPDYALSFEDEKEMLEYFKQVMEIYDPDVVTGYNIAGYDFPYIEERMRKHKIKTDLGRSDKNIMNKKFAGSNDTNINGRVVVDTYQIIKRDVYVRFVRYDLNTVSKNMLGEEKADMKYTEIPQAWAKDTGRLAEYAKQDASLAMKLLLNKGILDKFIEISKVSGIILQDSFRGQSVRIEMMLLREYSKRGMVIPMKPSSFKKEDAEGKITGGAVLEPVKGLHVDSIIVLDFQSLYPSIIKTYNISTDSLIIGEVPEGARYHTAPNGAKFLDRDYYDGVLPGIIESLLAARKEAKKMMGIAKGQEKAVYDAKQYALKILANAFYGYTGYLRARLFVADVANSITAYGRNNIETARKIAENDWNVRVIYGDSITKDRFVTIMDESGNVLIKNIQELFEENKEKTAVLNGKERILLSGYKALTVNRKNKQPCWSEIQEIIRHKTNKRIFRVNQKHGETIVTEDHSVITGDLFEETKPLEIQSKSIAKIESIPSIKTFSSVDLYEFLKNINITTLYKGREKMAKIHADDKHVWFGWTNRSKYIKLTRYIETPNEMEALCRLMGAYISEGSSSTLETSTRYGASIASSDVEWLKILADDCQLLFENSTPCIIRSTHGMRELNDNGRVIIYEDLTHKLQMMNALTSIFFKAICGQGSKNKKIPSFVYHLPTHFQEIVLDNMIKGDGSRKYGNKYSETYAKTNFRYHTKSLALISGLSFLLTLMGIKYTIDHNPKKCYRISTCSNYNKRISTKVTEETYEGYVYDLSVKDNHMFVDSCGQILLHNTDSLFIKVESENLDEIHELGKQIATDISQKTGLILEFEKIYKSFLILTKKRYAGWKFVKKGDVWEDSIDMRGIETVRRDWCKMVTETLNTILLVILKERDVKKAVELVKTKMNEIMNNKAPIETLVIVKGITKPPFSYDGMLPHIELAKKLSLRNPGAAPGIGDRIGFVIVRGKELLSKRAEDPEYIKEKGLQVDADYYINNQLLPPVERILQAAGVEKSELIGTGKQTSVFDAFEALPNSCKECGQVFRRAPLTGICDCGGTVLVV